MQIKTFIITINHLEDSVKSSQKAIQSALDVGFNQPIEIFDAVLPDEWKDILPFVNEFDEYERPDNVGACFASHYLLWQKCIELDEPILILEHDAIFKHNIPEIDFDMCVNLGRPSYIRPDHIIYEEPKDGLSLITQLNFLGHHAYAIKPEAAKIFCNDVKTRPLRPNDVWIDKDYYPWLQEYRPYPIHADTDFSTIQTVLSDDTPLMESYYEVTDPKHPGYEYLKKHFNHVLEGPQSERHIEVGERFPGKPIEFIESVPGLWEKSVYTWLRLPKRNNKYLIASWRMTHSEYCKALIRENFPETVPKHHWAKTHIPLDDDILYNFIEPGFTKVFVIISDPREVAMNLIHFDNGIHLHQGDYKTDVSISASTAKFLNEIVKKQKELIEYFTDNFGEDCIVLKYEDAFHHRLNFLDQVSNFLNLKPLDVDDVEKYRNSMYKNVGNFRQFFDEKVLEAHYDACKGFYDDWGIPEDGWENYKYGWHGHNCVDLRLRTPYKTFLKRNGIRTINPDLTFADKELHDRLKDINEL